MKNSSLFVLFLLSTLLSCKEEDDEPDISTGLTVNIPLDGTALELVSNTTGTSYDVAPATDRKGSAGKCMQFNAQDSSYITFGDLQGASFTNNIFTISVWVLAADTANNRAVLSKRTPTGPFEYSLDNHFNQLAYTLDNWIASGGGTVYGVDPLNAAVSVTPGTWQHIVYVADGTVLSVYINGVKQSATDARQSANSFNDTDAPFMVGVGGNYGINRYFHGSIDDIRIYNRALNQEEIEALHAL